MERNEVFFIVEDHSYDWAMVEKEVYEDLELVQELVKEKRILARGEFGCNFIVYRLDLETLKIEELDI